MRLRNLIIIILILYRIDAFAEKGSYNIKIKIKGLKDTVCFLGNYFGDKQYLRDTAKLNSKGEGVFKGKEDLPRGIYLIVTPDKKKYFEIIVNKEMNFSVETDTADFAGSVKFKGSDENRLFYEYINFMNKVQKKIDPLTKKYKLISEKKEKKDSTELLRKQISETEKQVTDYKNKFMKDHSENFLSTIFLASKEIDIPETPTLPNGKKDSTFGYRYYKKHFFDNIDFTDDRLLRTPVFQNKVDEYFSKLVYPKPDSIIKECDYLIDKSRPNKEVFKYLVWNFTRTYELSQIMGYDAIFVHLAKKYYTPEEASWAPQSTLEAMAKRVKELEPILIGKPAPNMIMQDTSLILRSLNDVKAKYTIVLFWDPECGHCQKEIPKLVKFYNEKKSVFNLEFYAVDSDTNMVKMKKFIKKEKMNWINVNGPRTLTKNFHDLYDINSTPVIFVLNEKKEIIAKKLGDDQLGDFLTNYEKAHKIAGN
jgi:thiol-disulfide isomerase/thioredoxin